MSDLINREDAIKAVWECYKVVAERDIPQNKVDLAMVDTIQTTLFFIPSADRPQGEWIKRFGSINCSVCKHSNWSDSFEDLLRSFNYCPNCGAYMKGEYDE